MIDHPLLTAEFIVQMTAQVRPIIRHTPLLYSEWLSRLAGRPVFLKAENVQVTGSFKVRGATARMCILTSEERKRGVITASAGNHGLGVAWAARRLGVPATVVVPTQAVAVKVAGIRALGARVVQFGDDYNQAHHHAEQMASIEGLLYIHAFADPAIIAGQSTVGTEILDELQEIDGRDKHSVTIVVPVGGGGLISGIALATKNSAPEWSVQLIGVQAERADRMARSLASGRPEPPPDPQPPTLADGLAGGVEALTLDLCQRYVDAMALVTEEGMRRAIGGLARHEHLVVEGSGAVGVAALLAGTLPAMQTGSDGAVVIVLTGGNIDAQPLCDALA